MLLWVEIRHFQGCRSATKVLMLLALTVRCLNLLAVARHLRRLVSFATKTDGRQGIGLRSSSEVRCQRVSRTKRMIMSVDRPVMAAQMK